MGLKNQHRSHKAVLEIIKVCTDFIVWQKKQKIALCYEQTSPLAVPRTASGCPCGLGLCVLHYFFCAQGLEKTAQTA